MLFHISCHHTPENCGVHRNPTADDGAPTPTITDWGARCQEVGVAYINGGINAPQHNHFMFVETDDMDKLRALMQPVMGFWDIVITPIVDLK